MSLADITHAAVLAAITEFDRLGREGFLRAAGFGRSRSYYLQHQGRLYDARAITGFAYMVCTGSPFDPTELSGGDKTIAHWLGSLGFDVRFLPNPDWTRDEIILACALVEASGWKQVDRTDSRVKELSELLQTPAIHPVDRRGPDFRNPAGVARKTADIATSHPRYQGKRTNGNRLDREVLNDFLARPAEMHAVAEAIRAAVATRENRATGPDLDLVDPVADEGGVLLRQHLRRERDPKMRAAKIADAKRRGLDIACEVCGFNFAETYGPRGADYIECHHRTPLHITGPTKTRLADLALICSNCHRMIHRTKPWLTVQDLRAIVQSQAGMARPNLTEAT